MLKEVGIKMLHDICGAGNYCGGYRCYGLQGPLHKEDGRGPNQSISMEQEAEGGLVVVLGKEEDFVMPCWTRCS
jgi:hypothetical protein